MACRTRSSLLRRAALAAAVLVAGGVAVPRAAWADADSDDKMSRLLDLLVQKKIVTQRQAHELLRQTEAPRAARHGHAVEEQAPPSREGEVRVTYVPQFVRKQIADEVRAQVLTESQQEGWAAPGVIPDWTKRFRLYGDLRVRYERDTFDRGNYPLFNNFAAINSGSGLDLSNLGGNGTGGAVIPPLLNTTTDRERPRVRARVGVEALIDDGLTADVRVTTGADNGPVSPNQTQGVPGDFSKYNVFIDRAFFKYEPRTDLTLLIGRENNPFFTTDLFFYSELGFDGLAAQYRPKLSDTIDGFFNTGVFPVLNTAFDFATTSETKFGSADAYLLAVQAGAKWQARPDVAAKLGVGFFDFEGVQGAVSKPCVAVSGVYNCSTDNTRVPFTQFGNTVFAIRDIDVAGQPPNSAQPEYFGLASRFAVLEVHPRVEITSYHPIDVLIEGEYLKNLAYNRNAILAHGPSAFIGPQNNFGSSNIRGQIGPYQGGDTAYVIKATVGNLEIHHRWDWNVTAAYKYLETDSTLDSITDSDFHLGGTNAKGYILTGSVGVARDTFLSLRYFSSQVVSGPPDGNQVLQLDLQSTF